MKKIQLIVALTISILAYLAIRPGLARAQGPTDLCVNGVYSDTVYSFTGASMPDGTSISTKAEWNDAYGSNFLVNCDPVGVHIPGNSVKTVLCTTNGYDNHYSIGTIIEDSISSPLSVTTTISHTSNNQMTVDCYTTNNAWSRLGTYSSGQAIPIPQGQTCDRVQFRTARHYTYGNKNTYSLSVDCAVGEYEGAETSTCDLVPNADFSINDDWLLAGTAIISGGVVTLDASDSTAQNLSGLISNSNYDASLVISQVVSPTILAVVLGNEIETIEVHTEDSYEVSFTTPNLAGPLAFGFENIGDYSLDIDFACLSLSVLGPSGEPQLGCVAPPNGGFDGSDDWNFENGAAYNSALNAALLPLNDPATNSNPFYTPAFIEAQNTFTLPTVITSENLLLSFEAQSLQNQNGLLTTLLQNVAQTIDYELIYEVYPQKYVFEADISDLAGETSAMLFGNDGGYPPDVIYPADISLDNVCIFVADRDPNLPAPVDPDSIAPVTIGQFYSCDDLLGYMGGYGIDMRYHQDNYANTPSVWNPQDWVPWLISASFVGLNIYLCAFFVALQSILNIIEYLLNNGLNYAHWFRRNGALALPWLASYYDNGLFSFDNFITALRETASDWLIWAALAVVEFASVPNIIVGSLALITLGITGGFSWLVFTQLPALLGWLLGGGNNIIRGLLNTLIEDGWNAFMVALGNIISEVLNVFIGIWNSGLLPFLLNFILSTSFGGVLSIVNLVPLFWELVWSVVQYLWVNVFQMINIPFAFYTGLSDGIQSTAFSDLLSCDGSTLNFWCNFLAAIDLLNGIAGQSIFYPIVIIGIIIGTIAILYRNVLALWNFYADWLSRL